MSVSHLIVINFTYNNFFLSFRDILHVDFSLTILQMSNSFANCFIYAKMHRYIRVRSKLRKSAVTRDSNGYKSNLSPDCLHSTSKLQGGSLNGERTSSLQSIAESFIEANTYEKQSSVNFDSYDNNMKSDTDLCHRGNQCIQEDTRELDTKCETKWSNPVFEQDI